ncbi:MAG: YheT family hydrolase [Lautropia sp.]
MPGAHLRTIWPALVSPRPTVRFRRERWSTPDGDFIDLDWLASEPPAAPTPPPLVAMFHGLEGSSDSHYCRAMMAALRARGWRGVVVHWRGCSGEPNLLARAYHSGDSDEVDWVLRRLRPDFVVGVSLGGNALLKWLGEQALDAVPVKAAVALCAPQDLEAGATALARGVNRLYGRHFLRSLIPKSLEKLQRFPGLYAGERVRAARDFFDFDGCVTAPLHGFRDAFDYWRRASCKPFLAAIDCPTLVINPLDDPFLPASALARPDEVSSRVRLEYPASGGHVGFATGLPPGRIDWPARRALRFFDEIRGGG